VKALTAWERSLVTWRALYRLSGCLQTRRLPFTIINLCAGYATILALYAGGPRGSLASDDTALGAGYYEAATLDE
jgi:hypothetical protein